MNKIAVWSEWSDVMQCWVWRYGVQDDAHVVPAGTAMRWHDAMAAAELLLYSQHHAQPLQAA
jgi:hypothetical protein